jgi:hypothetical protein
VRIRVLAVAGAGAGPLVTFACAAGRGVGLWRGVVPSLGAERDVELDLIRAAFEPTTRPVGLAVEAGRTRLVAWVEQADEDGVACLRLAPDALVLVEAELPQGGAVEARLAPEQLALTPIGG